MSTVLQRTVSAILFVLVLSSFLSSPAHAAAIAWSDPVPLVDKGVDVFPDATGIVLEAFNCNGPAVSVGGINFLADAAPLQYSNLKTVLTSKTGATVVLVADPAPTDAGLKTIISAGRFASCSQTRAFTLTNLVPGKAYQIQMITCDNRASGTESFHYSDGLGHDSAVFARRDDVWITGRFTADSATQDIQMVAATCTNFLINAYILSLPQPPVLAKNPDPADGATDVVRDVTCSWTSGPEAAKHDIYIGTNRDNVDRATPTADSAGVYRGRIDVNAYAPAALDPGQTYYWRVDEINAPPDNTVFKGSIWSFTTEPIAYEIAGVHATASSVLQATTGPENTVNGSGLNVGGLHSTAPAEMWMSGKDPNGAWIEFEFDRVYKLHQMLVWNSNQVVEPSIGYGCKAVSIEYSVDGNAYSTLGTSHQFAQAPGTSDYAPNTTIEFGGVLARKVRLIVHSNWGGILHEYGLSEVRFSYIPVLAREFTPASGSTDVDVDNVTLVWRAGREAALHNVYLGDDEQAVVNEKINPVGVPARSSHTTYDTGELDLGRTYYWKVNEINLAETPSVWRGDVCRFTTRAALVVEDFEDYNDFEPDTIYGAWKDGWDSPTNGSTAGYPEPDFAAGGHFVETMIVQSGKQSMPLLYTNTGGATHSEVERTLTAAQDWTKHGIQTLVLYFAGNGGNTGELYVKINDAKVVYRAAAEAISRPLWTQWNIDLRAVGTDLTKVKKLIVGVDGAGAQGTVYIDNICLYRQAPEPVVPQNPGTQELLASYALDSDTRDSSNNHFDGVAVGSPEYAAGMRGMAMVFDGFNDCVDLGNKPEFNLSSGSFSITLWANVTNWGLKWDTLVGNQDKKSGFAWLLRRRDTASNLTFSLWGTSGADDPAGSIALKSGRWYHVAAVYDAQAGKRTLYVNGQVDFQIDDSGTFVPSSHIIIGARPNTNEEPEFYFNGLLDEVRIYKKALSAGEVLYLATGK